MFLPFNLFSLILTVGSGLLAYGTLWWFRELTDSGLRALRAELNATGVRYEAMVDSLFAVATETAAQHAEAIADRIGSADLTDAARTLRERRLKRDPDRPDGASPLKPLNPPADALTAAQTFGSEVPGSVSRVDVFLETGEFSP